MHSIYGWLQYCLMIIIIYCALNKQTISMYDYETKQKQSSGRGRKVWLFSDFVIIDFLSRKHRTCMHFLTFFADSWFSFIPFWFERAKLLCCLWWKMIFFIREYLIKLYGFYLTILQLLYFHREKLTVCSRIYWNSPHHLPACSFFFYLSD